jgi:hypothetical protein
MRSERGQSTVEWVGMLSLISLLLVGMLAAGVRVPGTALADAVFEKIFCAVSMADSCGDEPHLIAAYGAEVGKLANDHMPSIAFERGSRALPVNFRRCRSTRCADAEGEGLVRRTDKGLPIAAFVHVVDCRPDEAERSMAEGADCSGERAGNLYFQYWTYYADSATLRGVPVVGRLGFHPDDWESVQVRIGPDGSIDQRASSHHGYNYEQGRGNWISDAGISPLRAISEWAGVRRHHGWGPETGWLYVSGGSHAGNAKASSSRDRRTTSASVHLIPLERIVASGQVPNFAVGAPWLKEVWRNPESVGTE